MSVLDDYLNKRKGSAFDLGKSLLRKQSKKFDQANVLKGVALVNKLLNNKRIVDVASDVKDFEANSLPLRSSLLAKWGKASKIQSEHETLTADWGQDLTGYFMDKARRAWKATAGYEPPLFENDPEAYKKYTSWVKNKSNKLALDYDARLKGSEKLGKLTQEEATAEFDRITRKTAEKLLSPKNLTWWRSHIDKALGKDNEFSVNIDAIESHLKDLASSNDGKFPKTETVTSGPFSVNVKQGEVYNPSNYKPKAPEMDLSVIVQQMYNNFPTLRSKVDAIEMRTHLKEIREKYPNLSNIKIKDILVNKYSADYFAAETIQKNADIELINKYEKDSSSIRSLIGKDIRKIEIKKLQDAYLRRLDVNPQDVSLTQNYNKFVKDFESELQDIMPQRATDNDIVKTRNHISNIRSGLTNFEGADLLKASFDELAELNTDYYSGLLDKVGNKVQNFAFKYPSVGQNINNQEVFEDITTITALKVLGQLENGNATDATLNDYYEFRMLTGKITEDEYLTKFSEIYNATETDLEKASAYASAVETLENKYGPTLTDDKVETINTLNSMVSPEVQLLYEGTPTKDDFEAAKAVEATSVDDFYKKVLDTPVVGGITEFVFGEDLGAEDIGYAVALIPGIGWVASGVRTIGGAAVKKVAPILATQISKKLLSNPRTAKMIESMRFKITQGNIYKDPKALKKYLNTLTDLEKSIFNSLSKTSGNLAPNQVMTNFIKIQGARFGKYIPENKKWLWYGAAGYGGGKTIEAFEEDTTQTTFNR